jgi:exodeoxyribonuclease V alpha subunit
MPEVVRLTVVVQDIHWPRVLDEGKWYKLGTDQGLATGEMSWRPAIGERLLLEGSWGAYKGQRVFRFIGAMVNVPEDARGKLAYLCSRASGVGPAIETAIWERWGKNWEPEIAESSIPRLQGRVWLSFQETLDLINSEAEKGRTMAWLLGKGASMAMANAAWGEWGVATIGIVQGDPYRLAKLAHFGFQAVDKEVRKHFGIEDGDPRRIRAGIIYTLHQLTSDGSTRTSWDRLHANAGKYLGAEWREKIVEETGKLFEEDELVGFSASASIALSGDYWNERTIWEFLAIEKGK